MGRPQARSPGLLGRMNLLDNRGRAERENRRSEVKSRSKTGGRSFFMQVEVAKAPSRPNLGEKTV